MICMKVRYKYRLRPGKQAEQYLIAEWDACRYVWNRMVDESQARHERGETFGAVVSSLRLDAVLAAAYHLSRSEAAEAIRAGSVKLNHLPCERTDAPVTEGALLSLRGRGRVRLAQIGGTTRKQRIGVTFFRYE